MKKKLIIIFIIFDIFEFAFFLLYVYFTGIKGTLSEFITDLLFIVDNLKSLF